MPIPLKFKLSSEADSAYASTKTGTGPTATLNVQCPENTGRAQRTQDFQVTVGTAHETVSTLQYGAATFVRWSNTGTTTVSKDTTSLSLTGYSNSSTLSFSTNSAGGLSVTIGTVRWMEANATDTGSNGTALSGINVTGDPGATRQYKFVVALTFAANAGATAKTCTVTVTGAGTGVTSTATISQGGEAYLTVSPASLTATAASGTQTFTVSTNGSNLSVTETTSSNILSVVSVTPNGNNTWEVVVHWGVNWSASSRSIGTLLFSIPEDTSLNKTISVTQNGAASGLTITGPNAVLVNQSITLTAKLNGEPTAVDTWVSNTPHVASISPAGSTCTLTGITAGTVTVTVRKEGYLPASTQIAVSTVVHVTSIEVDPTSLSLNVNETATVTAYMRPEDADFTPVFASSDPAVADVNSTTGLVTAISAGTATITASADDKSDSCAVTVAIAATLSIKCSSAYRLKSGTSAQLNQVWYTLIGQNSVHNNSAIVNVLIELVSAASQEDVAGATAIVSSSKSVSMQYTGEGLATPEVNGSGSLGSQQIPGAEDGTLWIRVSGSYQYNSRTWTFNSFTQVNDGLPRD